MFYMYDIVFNPRCFDIDSTYFKIRVTKNSVNLWGSAEYSISLRYNEKHDGCIVVYTSCDRKETEEYKDIKFWVIDSKLKYFELSLDEFITVYRDKQVKTLIRGRCKSTYPEKKLFFNRYEVFLYETLKTDIGTLDEIFEGVNSGSIMFKKHDDKRVEYSKPYYFCVLDTKILADIFLIRWTKLTLIEESKNF